MIVAYHLTDTELVKSTCNPPISDIAPNTAILFNERSPFYFQRRSHSFKRIQLLIITEEQPPIHISFHIRGKTLTGNGKKLRFVCRRRSKTRLFKLFIIHSHSIELRQRRTFRGNEMNAKSSKTVSSLIRKILREDLVADDGFVADSVYIILLRGSSGEIKY